MTEKPIRNVSWTSGGGYVWILQIVLTKEENVLVKNVYKEFSNFDFPDFNQKFNPFYSS